MPMTERRALPIPDGLDGARVDTGLAKLLGLPRTATAQIAAAGTVEQDGRAVGKSDRLRAGAWLEVWWEPATPVQIEAIAVPDLTVVHRDEDIIVVDKPAGVAAHPSPGWTGPTVLGALLAGGHRVSTSGSAERAGIVHRLDAGTSGLMVVAASERAYTTLKAAFKQRQVDKVYHAVAQGHPDPSSGTIDAPIGRHPRSDWKFAVTADGKPSVTHYRTLEAFPAASLLEVRLETGRTHQIRVHLAAQRHPCVGDAMYGADPVLSARLGLTRQWLHAVRLGFAHPGSGLPVHYESSPSADLSAALRTLAEH